MVLYGDFPYFWQYILLGKLCLMKLGNFRRVGHTKEKSLMQYAISSGIKHEDHFLQSLIATTHTWVF